MVVFNEQPDVAFHLNDFSTKEDIKLAISQLQFEGGRTNTSGEATIVVPENKTRSVRVDLVM